MIKNFSIILIDYANSRIQKIGSGFLLKMLLASNYRSREFPKRIKKLVLILFLRYLRGLKPFQMGLRLLQSRPVDGELHHLTKISNLTHQVSWGNASSSSYSYLKCTFKLIIDFYFTFFLTLYRTFRGAF